MQSDLQALSILNLLANLSWEEILTVSGEKLTESGQPIHKDSAIHRSR